MLTEVESNSKNAKKNYLAVMSIAKGYVLFDSSKVLAKNTTNLDC